MNYLWRIELFGGLCASGGERTIARFRTQKTAALLAYLALFPSHPHPREVLLELLWTDETLDAARNALRVALSSLRRQLEPPGTPHGAVLAADRSKINLDPTACTTDVGEFEALLAAARDAEETASLTRAVGLYRGDLLPELYDTWALGERARLAQACLGALHRLTRLLTQAGEFDRALDYAHRAVALDALCEKSHRLLMRLYAVTGRPAAARQQYRTLTQLLRAEMNVAPSPKTRDLAARLDFLATEARSALPVKSSPEPVPDEPRPSPAKSSPNDSFPVTFTRFFGRTAERERLAALLADPQIRLITLTGPGGNGKTRLAVETARGLDGLFAGGTWYVPLADVSDPRRLCGAILTALHLSHVASTGPWERIVAALAVQPVLLILDNFEQITAGAAPSVHSLLAKVPHLTCLVTSRRRLDVPGEHEFPVAPLPIPTEVESAAQVAGIASVQLFVDRAQAVRPDFAVTDRSAPDLAALCHSLEGVPLALELAAARIRALSLPQMRARLDHRFELLASQRSGKETRHRSLWAAISWSYDLLPAYLQRIFALLAVFRGGWSLEAAEAICEEPAALEALAQLRANSLLLAEDGLPDVRFRMLESLREFAWEQLSPEARESAAERHIAFFAAQAAQAGDVLQGADQGDWLRRFEADAANYFHALSRLEADPERADEALAMTTALYHFWLLSGRQHEGRTRLDGLLAGRSEPDFARAEALAVAGNLAEAEGDLSGARARMEEGLTLYLHLSRGEEAARLRGDLGIVASRQGRLAEAQAHWEATLAFWQSRNDLRRAAAMRNNLGILARRQGDTGTAQKQFLECLTLYQQIGDGQRAATVLTNLGLTADSRGDLDEAVGRFEESLVLHRTLGNDRGVAIALNGLGLTARKQGRLQEAQAYLAESLSIFARMEDAGGVLYCLQGLAETWIAWGLPEPAAVARGALTTMYRAGEITQTAGEVDAWAQGEQALAAALGPGRSAAARTRGEVLSPVEAAEYALSICRMPAP